VQYVGLPIGALLVTQFPGLAATVQSFAGGILP
jgi:hypothetical protein